MSQPTTIGPYSLLDELARGGTAVVYRARRDGAGPDLALKVLLGAGADERDMRRFEDEVRAAVRLQHPGIVPFRDAGVARGHAYLVMELVDGAPLDQVLRARGPLPLDEALSLTRGIGAALTHAHGHGILHRDVKPSNVVLTPDGRTRLLDFGIARLLDRDDRITATGEILGTPHYMAPEQTTGRPEALGPWTDVYGLGATLYHLLTGRPPFAGAPLQVVRQVLEAPPAPPSQHVPTLDPRIDELLLRCLAKSSAERPPTIAALLAELDALEAPPARGRGWLLPVALTGALLAAGAFALRGAAPPPPEPSAQASATPAPTPDEPVASSLAEARARLADHDLDAAEPLLAQATREAPADPEAWVALARARHALGERQHTIATCTSALAAVGRHPELLALRGRARLEVSQLQPGLDDLRASLALAPEAPRRWAELAEAALAGGSTDLARVAVAEALRRAPDQPLARLVSGRLENAAERAEPALEAFAVAARDPNRVGLTARFERARVLLGLDRRREAHAELEQFLERCLLGHPSRFVARGLLNGLRVSLGLADTPWLRVLRMSRALGAKVPPAQLLAQSEDALSAFPLAPRMWLYRGLALSAAGRKPEGTDALMVAVGLAPRSHALLLTLTRACTEVDREATTIPWLEALNRLDPTFAAPWVARGILLGQLGKWTPALEALDRALELQPDYPSALHERGAVLLYLKRPRAALADFRRLRALDRDSTAAARSVQRALDALRAAGQAPWVPIEALVAEARQRLRRGDAGRARACAERVLAEDPAEPRALGVLGLSLLRLRQPAAGVATLRRGVELNPRDLDLRLDLVTALEQHRQPGALEVLAAGLAFRPRSAALHALRSHALRRRGRLDEALKEAETAVQLDPGHADAYAARARVHFRREDLRRAREDLTRALERRPRGADDLELRSAIQRRLENPRGALADAKALQRLDPARGLLLEALVYVATNDLPRAVALLQQVVERYPRTPWARRARTLLDKIRRASGRGGSR